MKSFIRKGPPNHFSKGIRIESVSADIFRVTLSAGFAEVGCDFIAAEVETMIEKLRSGLKLGTVYEEQSDFNGAPTKENIDIEDEEARA